MSFHSLVNTSQFSEAAKEWKKNGGRYTTAPRGSRDYFQYWELQDSRCRYGFTCADMWIPGRYYYYLNFFPISKVPEATVLRALEERRSHGRLSQAAIEKKIEFPSFWEIHYEWANLRHIAWYGGEFMGVKSPGNKHLCCLKTRGAGWSYTEAADGCYNYVLIPGSKSYYFAGAEGYLVGDAIMDKVQAGLDWVNQYCPYWKQNRQVKKSVMHQKASYLDSSGVERGSFSEIIAQIVDKPGKTRGKRGRKIVFEEGGSFPNCEAALEVSLGSVSEGSYYVGQVALFGTGGEVGPSIQGLENVFGNPVAWDMLAFDNIWEDGYQATKCGYFVPTWRADLWYMDADGNVDMAAALHMDDVIREKKKTSGKPKDLDRRTAEHPRTPKEALQRLTGNGFNQKEIALQIARLETSKELQGMIRYGYVTRVPDTIKGAPQVEFVPQPKHIAKPIEGFPHLQNGDLKGCCATIERPYTDQRGRIPDGMYLLTFDAYYKEDSEDQTSLYSFKIWKLDNNISTTFTNLPVFWYSGRPARYEDNLDILFMAAELYNAKIQGEVSGGGQAVITYAKTYRMLEMLKHEPMMAHNKELASKAAGNAYLMNMATDRKRLGMTYLEDWHVQIRGLDDKLQKILNVHRIYDIAWLREMFKHDPTKGNYDRISDALVAMYELKENYANQIQKRRKASSFFKKELFGTSVESTGIIQPY